MNGDTSTDIVIAGAGIAGLALATSLAQTGWRVMTIEAGPRRSAVTPVEGLGGWDRRVSALTPSSQAFLKSLNAWSAIESQRVGPYTDMRVWDAEGTGEISFEATQAGVEVLGHIVENRLTVSALQAQAEAAGVRLVWEDAVTDIGLQSNGNPLLTCASGATVSAQLLVGADGARSRVRELADFETRSWSYGQRAIVATLELPEGHRHTCWQAFLPSGPLALLPLAQPEFCSLVWSLDDGVADRWAAADDAEFLGGLNHVVEPRGLRVSAASERAVFPLSQCHAIDYVQTGIALVADAAHNIHPLAGQGINLGLSDVRVLAHELERAYRLGLDPGSDAVLQRYQRQRKAENLTMMAAMEVFKRGFGSDMPLLRIARNVGLGWVDAMTPVKQWFIRQALG